MEIPTSRPTAPPHPAWRGGAIKKGSSGPHVAYVQNLLNQRLPPKPLWVDGIFGPKTDHNVRMFQTLKRLAVDGIVGPQTLGALEAGPPPIRKRPPVGGGGVGGPGGGGLGGGGGGGGGGLGGGGGGV